MYGFLYTPLIDVEISVKNDKVEIDKERRPWLHSIDPKFISKDENNNDCTSSDISVLYYIKWKYPSIPLVALNPHTVTIDDIHKNFINFYITYNRGEAYLYDTNEMYEKTCKILDDPSFLLPRQWQQLVDHKHLMFEYLRKHDINVLPYQYIPNRLLLPEVKNQILEFMKMHDIDTVVARPEFGSGCIGVKVISRNDIIDGSMNFYLSQTISKFPGVIFTPFVKDYLEKGEYKVYFVGGVPRYVFKQVNILDDKFSDIDEVSKVYNSTDPEVLPYVQYAKKVFATFPKLNICGKEWPIYYARVDVVCCWKNEIFINEIEAVPSLMPDYLKPYHHNFHLESVLGDEIARIIIHHHTVQIKERYTSILAVCTVVLIYIILHLFRKMLYYDK